MTPAQIVATTVQARRRSAILRSSAAEALGRIWARLGSTDESDIAAFTAQAAPVLEGAGRASSSLTSGYLSLITGRPVPAPKLELATDFRHPFIGVWRDLSRGVPFAAAQQTGSARAVELAQERVIRAQRQTLATSAPQGVVGWRRVPQGSTCSWCVLVSTQRYRSAESASFGHGHHGIDFCDCDIVPIFGRSDPGRVINRPMLAAWKQAQKDAEKVPRWFDADSLDVIDGPDAARLADAALAA